MNRLISIKELSPSTVTRSRGSEAYTELLDYLKSGEPVEIDLRGQELISMSFLDEMVIKLSSAGLLDKVTFLVTNETIYQRLAQVAAIRCARIFYKPGEGEERKIIESKPVHDLELRKARS